jgi:DNA-binding NtrC family response regulator
MVVDDEPNLVDIFSQCLGAQFTVSGFTSPDKALAELREQPADLLVSDLLMPGLNGLQLTAAAKELCPDLKVVLVSGVNPRSWHSIEPRDLDRVDIFLLKPMSLATLLRCCAQLLSHKMPSLAVAGEA